MCLYSHWQLKANIYILHRFLYSLIDLRQKGHLSYCSYCHRKKFYKNPVWHFLLFLGKIFWPSSFGSMSAISHAGTLKLLKQPLEDFSGSRALAPLAQCLPMRLHTQSKWRHNQGTPTWSFTPRASCRARETGGFVHIHGNTSPVKSTHQKCLFLQWWRDEYCSLRFRELLQR